MTDLMLRSFRIAVRYALQCVPLLLVLPAWAGDPTPGLQRVRTGAYEIAVSIATPQAVRGGHPKGHPEEIMHGGRPEPGDRHVFVSIVDAKSRARIDTASVRLRLTDGKGRREDKPLERMTISGHPGYGNYFALAAGRPLKVDLEIGGLGRPFSVGVEFRDR